MALFVSSTSILPHVCVYRNFPTLANVEKKMKLMEAKEERGEVLQTAEFG